MAKMSLQRGTQARSARSKVAEGLKRRYPTRSAFAIATAITKRASPAGRRKLAERGLRRR